MIKKLGKNAWRESGLASVYMTGWDAWLIILCRSCRMFAYGSSSLFMALFFSEIDISDSQIGLFMTLTLVGDVILSLILTLVADKIGRRRTLLAGALLMVMSGSAFVLSENYWVLLVAAVVGVISATGSDFGPFRAIEESILSELTTPATRADVLSWYVTSSTLGSSIGTEMSGRIVEWLRSRDGWTLLDAYHASFWVYGIMGMVNVLSSLVLSENCELEEVRTPAPEASRPESEFLLDDGTSDDRQPLGSHQPAALASAPPKNSRFAQISRETRSVMYGLWFLLMVDSLADGMANMSLTTYYMDEKFRLSKSAIGDVVSAGYFICTVTSMFAGPLARHIGLVSTMVFTHIPSSAAVLLFPAPRSAALMFTLLLLRLGLNNMDQAPRAALIAAVTRPDERTAVMGVTSMLRTLASTVGPSVTGLLAGHNRFWIAFVVAGALRLAYDVGVFVMFINIKLYKHESALPEPSGDLRRSADGRGDEETELDERTRPST